MEHDAYVAFMSERTAGNRQILRRAMRLAK